MPYFARMCFVYCTGDLWVLCALYSSKKKTRRCTKLGGVFYFRCIFTGFVYYSVVVSGEKALARLRGLNPNHIGSNTDLYK